MMTENDDKQTTPETPKPNSDLKDFERLIGTWKVSGGLQGTQIFEWAEGGFFLIQHFDFDHAGRKVKGIEIIGHEHKFGDQPSAEIKTRVFSFMDGTTLDYVYEMDGDTLTIWGEEKNSPAYFKGEFSGDGDTLTGGWVYPGGGYEATATRVK